MASFYVVSKPTLTSAAKAYLNADNFNDFLAGFKAESIETLIACCAVSHTQYPPSVADKCTDLERELDLCTSRRYSNTMTLAAEQFGLFARQNAPNIQKDEESTALFIDHMRSSTVEDCRRVKEKIRRNAP